LPPPPSPPLSLPLSLFLSCHRCLHRRRRLTRRRHSTGVFQVLATVEAMAVAPWCGSDNPLKSGGGDKFDQTERVGSPPWCGQQAHCLGMSIFQAWAVVERPWPTMPMGSMIIKIVKLWLTKKRRGEGSELELRRESAYDSNGNGTDLHTGLYVLWLRYGENCKASCTHGVFRKTCTSRCGVL
jgi:hypothetical protein